MRGTNIAGYTRFVVGIHPGYPLWVLGDAHVKQKNGILAIHCFIVSGEEPLGNERLGD